MNYIQQLNLFDEWVINNAPSTGQIALYNALLAINNKCGWKEWFTAPSIMIEIRTGLTRQGIHKARNFLVDYKLIEFIPQGGSKAGIYKIIELGSGIVYTNVDTMVDTNDQVVESFTQKFTHSFTIPKELITTTTTDDTVMDIHTKVFKTFSMSGLMTDYVRDLKEKGFTDTFIKELMLETGEAGTSPSLRLMQTIGERWIKEGIYTRVEAKRRKDESKLKVSQPSKPIAPKEYIPDPEILRLLREAK